MADLLASRRTAPEQDIGLELQSAFAVLRQRLAGESAGETPPVATLEAIARAFDLDRFACDVILLAAIAALEPDAGTLIAKRQGVMAPIPTIGLALSVFPQAHWSALTAEAPLRRH